jgi:SHO1 osmosensor
LFPPCPHGLALHLLTALLQLAWIISFVATILAHVQTPFNFPLYTYWAIVFYLAVIVGVSVVVASDSAQTYHVALVGYLGCGLVLSTSSVNGLIHTNNGAKEASAAGFILLAMVTVRTNSRCGASKVCMC